MLNFLFCSIIMTSYTSFSAVFYGTWTLCFFYCSVIMLFEYYYTSFPAMSLISEIILSLQCYYDVWDYTSLSPVLLWHLKIILLWLCFCFCSIIITFKYYTFFCCVFMTLNITFFWSVVMVNFLIWLLFWQVLAVLTNDDVKEYKIFDEVHYIIAILRGTLYYSYS